MYILHNLIKKSFIKRSAFILALLATLPPKVLCTDNSSSARQEIEIFRKEIPKSELSTLDFSPSKQGKKAICHLSNKKKKAIWVDKEVLDKIEERTVREALQRGYRDMNLTCDFKEMESKFGVLDGIVATPLEGQIVFYDVISQK